jgi:hypothetical protein
MIPRSKVQLIRQQPRLAPAAIAFYAVLVRETNPVLYAFYVETESDLLALDLVALAAEDPAYADHIRAEPLFLTCTHGRRDKCCARYGLPVYEGLAQYAGADVWQSSHLGGHRLAANLVALPPGSHHGRVTPDSAAALIDAYRAGRWSWRFTGGVPVIESCPGREYYRQEARVTGRGVPLWNGTGERDQWEVRISARAAQTYDTDARVRPGDRQLWIRCRRLTRSTAGQFLSCTTVIVNWPELSPTPHRKYSEMARTPDQRQPAPRKGDRCYGEADLLRSPKSPVGRRSPDRTSPSGGFRAAGHGVSIVKRIAVGGAAAARFPRSRSARCPSAEI